MYPELRAVEPEVFEQLDAGDADTSELVGESLFGAEPLFFFQGSSSVDVESFPMLQASASGQGEVTDLPKFTCKPYDGGMMQIRGLDYPLVVDLETVNVSPTLAVFREQDMSQIAGHALKSGILVTPSGVEVKGVFSGKYGPEIVATSRNGFVWYAQLAATQPGQLDFLAAGDSETVNGRTVTGPLIISRYQTIRALAFSVFATGDSQEVAISKLA